MKKFLFLLLAATLASPMLAQTTTSGDLAGTLSDPTGAVIPGAKITATNMSTGESKTVTSGAEGAYRVASLPPGNYRVSATATNFTTTQNMATVSAGVISTDNLKLTVGQQSTTVEVSAAPQIVNTTNADVTTTFSSEQVQAMPNPGNDLTFVAQTAPGSVMNTGTAAGGYGNFSSFGISGLSNMFTLDGGYENDPFLNLNNTGASNLTLGNNEVDTVTVVTPAYSSQFGGLGGAQVNEITTSGGNHVHGNLSYYWDGRALNSNDFFNKQAEAFYGEPNLPTFVNANQYAASIGGPIIKDKLFWFINTEGIRATTPQNANIDVPNLLSQNCSLGADPGGTVVVPGYGAASGTGSDTVTYSSCAKLNSIADEDCINGSNAVGVGNLCDGIPFAAAPATDKALMTTIFGVYNNSPLRASTAIPSPIDPSTNTYYAKNSALLTEYLVTGRIDYHLSAKDNIYGHYKQDHGIQPTYTDLVDPRFTAASVQPAYEGQGNWTHTFTPNLVNQLVLTGNYYSAPFENNNNYSPVAPFTFIPISGSIGYYGGENYAFPQGRNVSGYQVIDDVSYNKGRNTVRWGYNLRRDNITDLQGEETVSPAAEGSYEGFIGGTVDYEFIERFPVRSSQPVSVYDMGGYVEDSYKLTPAITLTAGLRVERNSNPTCHTNCFSTFNGSVGSLPTGTANASSPYSAAFPGGLILGNRYRAFTGYQKAGIMPRLAINYQMTPKTTLRAGFGIFTDTFPGLIADDALGNVPTQFKAAAYGYVSGRSNSAYDVNPASPTSGNSIAGISAIDFRQGFASGGSYNTVSTAVQKATGGSPYATPSFIASAPSVSYPTYEEFSVAIERRLGNKNAISVTYVGNHGYHEPVSNASINLATSFAGQILSGQSYAPNNGKPFFPTLPTSSPITSFATVTNIYSGASSNYNGIVFSGTRRAKDLTLQFNYEFSKALDEISNGGLEPFAPDAGDSGALVNPSNLASNYGPADYNVKHNVTASFVYELPTLFHGGNSLVRGLVGGFEFSGNVFHQSGLPYSITQDASASGAGVPHSLAGGSVLLLAQQTSNSFDHHCGGASHALLPDGTLNKPCDFAADFQTPTTFAQQGRNSLVGPSYTNINLGAFKTFGVPHFEGAKLKLGAQMFNLFNHTNFQNPVHDRGANNSELGGLDLTVGAPTSILGSTGGADAAPRLIQLHAALVF